MIELEYTVRTVYYWAFRQGGMQLYLSVSRFKIVSPYLMRTMCGK